MDMVAVKAKRSFSRSFSTKPFHAFTNDATVTSSFHVGSINAPGVGAASSSGDLTLMLPVAVTTCCLAFRNPAARGALAAVAGAGAGAGAGATGASFARTGAAGASGAGGASDYTGAGADGAGSSWTGAAS